MIWYNKSSRPIREYNIFWWIVPRAEIFRGSKATPIFVKPLILNADRKLSFLRNKFIRIWHLIITPLQDMLRPSKRWTALQEHSCLAWSTKRKCRLYGTFPQSKPVWGWTCTYDDIRSGWILHMMIIHEISSVDIKNDQLDNWWTMLLWQDGFFPLPDRHVIVFEDTQKCSMHLDKIYI
jgi:hypothetical protein